MMKNLKKVIQLLSLSTLLLVANTEQSVHVFGEGNKVRQIYNKGLSSKEINSTLKSYINRIKTLEKKLTRRVSPEIKYQLQVELGKAKEELNIKTKEVEALNELIKYSNSKVVKKASQIYKEKGLEATLNFFNSKEYDTFSAGTVTNMKEVSGGYIFQAKILKIANKYDEVKGAYKNAIKYGREPSVLFEYAGYLVEQIFLDEAIEMYKEAMFDLKSFGVRNSLEFNSDKILILKGLAFAYEKKSDYIKAQEMYEEALILNRKIAKKDPSKYNILLLNSLNALGLFYEKLIKLDKSKQLYNEALMLARKLVKKNPTKYNLYLALTLINIAPFHSRDKEFKLGIKKFQESLLILQSMEDKTSSKYKKYIAGCLDNLGNMYRKNKQFKKSLLRLKESENLHKELVNLNPKMYLPKLANTLNNLATIYEELDDINNFKKSIAESLKIYRALAKNDSIIYNIDIANNLVFGVYFGLYNGSVLDEASILLSQYKNNPKATMLIGRIKILRERKEQKKKINDVEKAMDYYSIGEALFYQKSYEGAISFFQKEVEKNPNNEDAYILMGIANLNLNKIDRAILIYKKVIKINSKNSLAHYNLGVAYSANKNIKDAQKSYEKAIEIDIKDHKSYLQLGRIYHTKGELSDAIVSYRKVIGIEKNDIVDYKVDAYNNLGIIYLYQQKFEKTIEAYRASIELNPKNEKGYLSIANIYFDKKEYSKALEAVSNVVTINPRNERAYLIIGTISSMNQNYDKAIKAYKEVLKINPKNKEVENILNLIERELGNDGVSEIQSFRNNEDYYKMGTVLFAKKEYEKAIELFKKAIEINPQNDAAYTYIGIAHKNKEEYSQAIEAYKKAIDINPKSDNAYYNMGFTYEFQKEYKQAIKSYINAVTINSKNAGAYYNMGMLYELQEEYKEAIESYERVLKLYPNDEKIKNILRLLEIKATKQKNSSIKNKSLTLEVKKLNENGELLYHKKQFKKAIDLYIQAIKLNSNYAQSYSNLGLAYQKLKQDDDALWANDKAIEVASGENKDRLIASSSYNIAKIYEKYSKWEEALKYYKNALLHKEHKA